jgi:hypothetical protein
MPDRAKAIAQYQQHIEDVKAALPPERLLIYSVDQGWKPLCDFLGVAIPNGKFPNINDRVEFQKIIRNMIRGAYAILGVGAVIAAAAIYGLVRLAG